MRLTRRTFFALVAGTAAAALAGPLPEGASALTLPMPMPPEGTPPSPKAARAATVDIAYGEYVAWTFDVDGKTYGSYKFLENDWQIANKRLMATLWSEDYCRTVESVLGLATRNFTSQPENLVLYSGGNYSDGKGHQERLDAPDDLPRFVTGSMRWGDDYAWMN
jgi:hypothetical protein